MSAVEIDREGAARARSWTVWSDELDRSSAGLGGRLEQLDLGDRRGAACVEVDAAVVELRTSAEFVRSVADKTGFADWLVMVIPGMAADLWAQSRDRIERHDGGSCSPGGDVGGTCETVWRPSWAFEDASSADAGHAMVRRALLDTADPCVIAEDEFEIVQTGEDRFVVVLPGVIDLSSPKLGFDASSESVRDLDQGALRSATSSRVEDNLYARYVADTMREYLPAGANVAIVGHSYGADTALDLAADPTLNGEKFTISHVVAAGYYTDRQERSVPAATRVLSLQNASDAAVIAEAAGYGPNRALHGATDAVTSTLDGDVRGMADGFIESNVGIVESIAGAGAYVHDRADDFGKQYVNSWVSAATFGSVDGPFDTEPADLLRREPTVEVDGEHTRIVFDGGDEGFGHAQENYLQYLEASDEPAVDDFMESLTDAGYTSGGRAQAIDISWRR